MRTPTRVSALLLGAAGAGVLIWLAGRFDSQTRHDYWISLGLVAAAGLVLGIAHLRSAADRRGGLLVALPAAAVAVWVALAAQPTGSDVMRWSRDIGIGGVVRDLGVHAGVLAFGAALVVGTAAVLLPRRSPATVTEPERYDDEVPHEHTAPVGAP
jgi:hypothetical protein